MLIKNAITSLAIIAAVAICLTFAGVSQANANPCYYGMFMFTALEEGPGPDGTYRPETINPLRESGYAAMDDLQYQYLAIQQQIDQINAETSSQISSPSEQTLLKLTRQRYNLAILIDQVGQQRDATTSGLMWHTSLDEAITEAKETDKPILSLRMLGKLTDEFSCANSRFFRTTLYSNKEISKKLRQDFVLHWKSVRPVPKLTIDFGDGRTLERTITGNSAHYMLDKNGQPLDCLPGLYGPGEFSNWLGKMVGINSATKNLESVAKVQKLREYHRNQNTIAGKTLERELAKFDPELVKKISTTANNLGENPKSIAARLAAPIAFSKSVAEVPILNLAFNPRSIDVLEQEMDDAKWEKLAELHAGTERLDESSIAVIKRENPSAVQASGLTTAKRRTEDKLTRLVEGFERSILIDTVRNEYLLHRKIHSWFADKLPTDVEVLNKRVYAELFLTPDSDPWLGLKPEDVYTALENDGVKVAAKK